MSHYDGRVLLLLSLVQELFRQLTRCLVLRPNEIECPQSIKHRENLSCFPHLRAKLTGPRVGLDDFLGPIAFRRHLYISQRNLQRELLLSALRSVWQASEQGQGIIKKLDCFLIGVAVYGLSARFLQIINRLGHQGGVGVLSFNHLLPVVG